MDNINALKQKKNKNVAVIGAGIIGSCCALRLIREGYNVTLIDRYQPGSGCSYGNAGGISSGSVIPMALPGLWKKVPGWLMDKSGPLSVNWGYLPKASPWLLKWVLSSTEKTVRDSSLALLNLHRDTTQAYKNLLGETNFTNLVKNTGHLYVYRKKPTGKGDRLAASLRNIHGINVQEVNSKEINDIEPAIANEFGYGMYIQDASFTTDPQRLVSTLVTNFQNEGGKFVQDEVKKISGNVTHGYSIATRASNIKAEYIVIATGAWSKELLPKEDRKIPLETERGYHIMLHEPNLTPSLPVIAGDYKFFSTPMENGLRLAGTVEISGLSALPNWRRSEILLDHAKKVFPGLQAAGSSVWMGNRPSLPDSVPLIDESIAYKNVFYAFGHGHYGLSGGPGTADIICDLVGGKIPKVNIEPYSLSRFLN